MATRSKLAAPGGFSRCEFSESRQCSLCFRHLQHGWLNVLLDSFVCRLCLSDPWEHNGETGMATERRLRRALGR